MAIFQHLRVRYIDYIRKIIGDEDKVLFTDDELKSSFDKWSSEQLSTATLTCYNLRYRMSGCGCGCTPPVWKFEVTSGVDNATYTLDEAAGSVWFDTLDPAPVAPPADGHTIEVAFYTMSTNKLLSELFFTLSSNHAKLKMAHSIMGVGMDLKELGRSFYDQSIMWELESPGCSRCC